MADRPILFSAEMVRAILAGQKSQTRRVITPANSLMDGRPGSRKVWGELDFDRAWTDPGASPAVNRGPYLKVPRPWIVRGKQVGETVHRIYPKIEAGDRLWVRETHRLIYDSDNVLIANQYRADSKIIPAPGVKGENITPTGKWKPSIFMKREYSRLTLPILSVRPERLQDISETDAIAEGIDYNHREPGFPNWWDGTGYVGDVITAFKNLWDSINGKRNEGRFSWAANPWLWVYTFDPKGGANATH